MKTPFHILVGYLSVEEEKALATIARMKYDKFN